MELKHQREFPRRRTVVAVCAFLLGVSFSPGPQVAQAQLATSPWPMEGHDLAHTGLSQYDTSGNPGNLKWKFSLEVQNSIFFPPAIGADGTIYLGDNSENLVAMNPDGTQKWALHLLGIIDYSSPAIGVDGTVYVGTNYGFFAANPDGTKKWAFTAANEYSAPAIGSDGTIYASGYVSGNSGLYALNPDGTQKWAFAAGGLGYSSPAVGADGTIYVGLGNNGDLYAVNPDGTQKWVTTGAGVVDAIGADGTLYAGNGGDLNALNPDGTQKWQFETGGSVSSSPAIGSDGTVYLGSNNGDLYAVNPDGTQKWALNILGTVLYSSPAIGADGTIYVGSSSGNLYAVNPDGTQKWSFAGSVVTFTSQPVIGADGTLYVTAASNQTNPVGALYAVGVGVARLSLVGSVAFGPSPVGDTVTKNLTLRNSDTTNSLYITGVTSSDPSQFAIAGNTCPNSDGGLKPGLSCTITIAFTPSALGVRSATLTVNDNTATIPQSVSLAGTGTVDMTVTPANFAIGDVKEGSKVIRAVTVHNFQTASVSLGEGFSGPNAGDFSITGGTCTSTLAAKTVCTLLVTFAPTSVGTESATLTVTDSPDTLAPYTVSFMASATVPESLSATRLAFGNVYETTSKTLNITVTNKATTGSITLTGTTIGGANSGDFAVTGGTCTGSLAASSSCTYAVTFTPSTETAETGMLSIGVMEDPNGGPPAVALTGTGSTPLKVTPASLAFGTFVDGHSSNNRTVTVINDGGAATISEGITGTNSGDFAVTGGTCLTLAVEKGGGSLLNVATSCTYTLKFTPSIVGAESATFGVSAVGDAASPHNVSLGGTGSGGAD